MKTELAILKEEVPANEVVAVFMKNNYTGGTCCYFKHNNKYYYADKSPIPYSWYDQETMIFPFDFEKQVVSDWGELYVYRTGKSLEDCIEQFTDVKNIRSQYIDQNNSKNINVNINININN